MALRGRVEALEIEILGSASSERGLAQRVAALEEQVGEEGKGSLVQRVGELEAAVGLESGPTETATKMEEALDENIEALRQEKKRQGKKKKKEQKIKVTVNGDYGEVTHIEPSINDIVHDTVAEAVGVSKIEDIRFGAWVEHDCEEIEHLREEGCLYGGRWQFRANFIGEKAEAGQTFRELGIRDGAKLGICINGKDVREGWDVHPEFGQYPSGPGYRAPRCWNVRPYRLLSGVWR